MTPFELTTTITIIANIIASDLPDDDLNLLAALFTQLGDTLATISAQRALCKSQDDNSNSNSNTDNTNPSKTNTSKNSTNPSTTDTTENSLDSPPKN